MRVSLNTEQWTVRDDTSLLEVLADISNKARGRGHIVTALKIGGRPHTDRDLIPSLLARAAKDSGPVEALSSATTDILLGAKEAVTKFGDHLKTEAATLTRLMRSGTVNMASVDQWLGQLAEYMEITERAQAQQVPGFHQDSLGHWVEQLIDARAIRDLVRMADVLEYELIPRIRH
jgi:hypothetical protein